MLRVVDGAARLRAPARPLCREVQTRGAFAARACNLAPISSTMPVAYSASHRSHPPTYTTPSFKRYSPGITFRHVSSWCASTRPSSLASTAASRYTHASDFFASPSSYHPQATVAQVPLTCRRRAGRIRSCASGHGTRWRGGAWGSLMLVR